MSAHFVPWLYFDDGAHVHEVINGARTIENLRNAPGACVLIGGALDPGCDQLYKDPCDDTLMTFTTPTDPANPAPWWDGVASSPSSNAYGIWVEEWTGLDGAQMKRSATAGFPRGSVFGRLGQMHRVWKINALIFGADDAALQALFRWLEDALMQCCTLGTTAWARLACPDGYDSDTDLVHVVDLELLEGLEWVAPPERALSCFVRRISFTLGVADPCLYKPPVNCAFDDPFPSGSVIVTTTGSDELAQTGSTTLAASVSQEFEWEGALTDWTPASEQTLIAMTTNSNPNFGFRLGVTTSGAFRLRISTNGSSFGVDLSSTPLATDYVANGETLRVKVTRNGTTGVYDFEFSTDHGVTWDDGGAVYAPGTTGSLFATTTNIRIGDAAGSNRLVGSTNFASLKTYDSSGVLTREVEFQPEVRTSGTTWVDPESGLTWTLGSPGVAFADEGEVDLCGAGLSGILGCPLDEDAFAEWRLCCPVVGTPVGVTSPVVIVRNNGTESYSPPLRVIGVGDNGSGCLVANNARGGEVRVSGVPPQSELMIDCARRRVLWRPVGYTRGWEPGYTYLDSSSDVVPEYPSIGCHDGYIFVEPTALAPSLLDLQVTVDMVGRYGCC